MEIDLFFIGKQYAFNKGVDVSVEDAVHVSDFEVDSMIFCHLVGMEHVRSDLASPGDIVLAFVHLLQLFVLLLFFFLMKPCPQNFHRQVLVPVLGFLLLALHYNCGWKMSDPHGAAGLVDMLSAGARRPENVYSKILVIDIHNDFLVDFRVNEHGRERRVAFPAGVERGNPYKAVHAGFSFQETIGVLPAGSKSGAFNSGLVSWLKVYHVDIEASPLDPPQVHPKEHFSPVLGLCSTRARVDGKNGVIRVVLAVEHHFKGILGNFPANLFYFPGGLRNRFLVGFLDCKIQKDFAFFETFMQLAVFFDFPGCGRALFEYGFGLVRVIPKSVFCDQCLQFFQPFFLARKVKDNLAIGPFSDSGPLAFVSIRTT